jgi:DNA-binding beta-propeller fold protein YncE
MVTQTAPFLKYSFTIGISAMDGRGFYYPTDTVFGKNGRIYVPNKSIPHVTFGTRICICDADGGYYGVFGRLGEGDGQFKWHSGGAADSEGLLYFSDEHLQRISVFDEEGGFVSKWGVYGSGEGELDTPTSLAFDEDDILHVSDTYNCRVQKFTKDGQFIASFGSKGDGDGQFEVPWGVTISPSGDVYVADWGNDRIQRFTPDGEFVASYGSSGRGDGQFHRPASVAVDGDGYIYVADWGNERVQVLDPEGGFVIKLRGEATLSVWAEEFLDANAEEAEARAAADLEGDIDFFNDDPHEESSHIEKYFWAPVAVKLDDAGRLFVTDSNRHRIQVYERGG